MGDVAVDFVWKQRASFFPEIPIVFATADPVPVMPNSTGIMTPIRQRKVLETALRVQPDTRHVAIVAGSSAYDRYYVRSAREEFKPYEDRLTFTYLTGLPMRELLSRVATLPPQSIILFMGVTQDGEGRLFLPQEMLESVSTAANAPTYGWSGLGMDHGLVGGTMNTPEVTAQRMAALGLRVMQGERAEDIAVTEIDSTTTQFDWRQLRRWNISEGRLPPNSTILFRELGPWELYRAYIMGGGADYGRAKRADRRTRGPACRRRRVELALRQVTSRAEPGSVRPVDQRPGGGTRANRARSARRRQPTAGGREHHVECAQAQSRHAGFGARCRANGGDAARPHIELADAIRNLSHQLHPAVLQHTGLMATLGRLCADIEQHHHLSVSLSAEDELEWLNPDVALCLFRVAQEALTNATRHGRARTICVSLTTTPTASS